MQALVADHSLTLFGSPVHRDDSRGASPCSILVPSSELQHLGREGAFIAGDSGLAHDSVEGVAQDQVEAACKARRLPVVVASVATVASLRRSNFDVRCVYVGLGQMQSNVR